MQLHVPAGRVSTRHGRCLPRRQAKTSPTPRIFALQSQLPVQLAPLAYAQEAKEVAVAPLAQLRLGHVLVRDAVGVPEPEDAAELGLRVAELRVCSVGRGALVCRPLARVLDAQERGGRQPPAIGRA